jgi:hypothetical protein
VRILHGGVWKGGVCEAACRGEAMVFAELLVALPLLSSNEGPLGNRGCVTTRVRRVLANLSCPKTPGSWAGRADDAWAMIGA